MMKNNQYLKIIDLKNSNLLSYKKIILNNKVNLFINLKKTSLKNTSIFQNILDQYLIIKIRHI